ncbi:MAG: response regulator transcription factor [Ignavibacteriae bacterium]|nr:response regulator transcription factor [Ignavibacteria bacterium]MBI3363830.1 response regulator transcription factor [Ignavibacteriota bacterium]
MSKKILVVDDEKDIVEMLSYNLRKEGYEVLTAFNGRDALERAKERLDLILLDVMMPEMDGLHVIRELKRNKNTDGVPVLFLTAKGSESDEIVGLELGAEDYIIKPISIGKLIARVRAVFRRYEQAATSALDQSEIIGIGAIEINVPNYTVTIEGREIQFVRKEFEILVYLVRNRGRVVTRESILNGVWKEKVFVVDRTVDVHIRKIREKLGKYERYIETVKGVGYRFKT